MNGKVDYLINYIKRAIPPQILEGVFCKPTVFTQIRPSLEYELRNKIIDGWVAIDCNVVGGKEVHVDLSLCTAQSYPGGTLVRIPPSATSGKNITAVLDLSLGMGSYYGGFMGNQITDAALGPDQWTVARVQLVGPNQVYIEGGIISSMRFLRCIVENDADFANINDRSLPVLGELCVLATKAYCYNQAIIKDDSAAIFQGVTMGRYVEILNEYADALEMYNELRDKKWKKVSYLNDRETHNKHIRMLMKR